MIAALSVRPPALADGAPAAAPTPIGTPTGGFEAALGALFAAAPAGNTLPPVAAAPAAAAPDTVPDTDPLVQPPGGDAVADSVLPLAAAIAAAALPADAAPPAPPPPPAPAPAPAAVVTAQPTPAVRPRPRHPAVPEDPAGATPTLPLPARTPTSPVTDSTEDEAPHHDDAPAIPSPQGDAPALPAVPADMVPPAVPDVRFADASDPPVGIRTTVDAAPPIVPATAGRIADGPATQATLPVADRSSPPAARAAALPGPPVGDVAAVPGDLDTPPPAPPPAPLTAPTRPLGTGGMPPMSTVVAPTVPITEPVAAVPMVPLVIAAAVAEVPISGQGVTAAATAEPPPTTRTAPASDRATRATVGAGEVATPPLATPPSAMPAPAPAIVIPTPAGARGPTPVDPAAPPLAPAMPVAPTSATPVSTVTVSGRAAPRDGGRPDTDGAAPPSPAPAPAPAAPPVIGRAAEVFADARFAASRDRPRDEAPAIAPAATPTTQPPALPTPVIAAAQPVDLARPDWPAAMIERVELLADEEGADTMRLRLTPDRLGGVEVTIVRDADGRVTVDMVADRPEARQMLAEAAPRLGELAAGRGLRLGGEFAAGDASAPRDGGGGQPAREHRPAPRSPRPADPSAAEAAPSDNRIA